MATIDRSGVALVELGYAAVSMMLRENHDRHYVRINSIRNRAKAAIGDVSPDGDNTPCRICGGVRSGAGLHLCHCGDNYQPDLGPINIEAPPGGFLRATGWSRS